MPKERLKVKTKKIFNAFQFAFQFVFVGDSSAGKTSLIWRLKNPDNNLPDFIPTVMKNELINIEMSDQWKQQVMMWDTAGQEDYDR